MTKRANVYADISHKRTFFDSLKSAFLDLRFGFRILDKEKVTPFSNIGCYHTQSTEYEELKWIFDRVDLQANDVVMDVGCGRGRPFNYLLSRNFTGDMIGTEIDSEIANFTAKRLRKQKNIRIISGNALDYIENRISLYFMYNPFKAAMFLDFVSKIESVHSVAKIIYFNPQNIDFILSRNGWKAEKQTFFSRKRRSYLNCYYMYYNRVNVGGKRDRLQCYHKINTEVQFTL